MMHNLPAHAARYSRFALLALAFTVTLPVHAQEAPPPAPPLPTPPGVPAFPTTPSQMPPGTSTPAPVEPPTAGDATPQPAPVSALPEAAPAEASVTKPKQRPLLGLGLATPDTSALPGRFRPSFGVVPASASDYRFDFHGFLTVPLRFGTNERRHPTATQYKGVFHGPPVVPDDFDRFEHTGVVPQPWTQLAFSYGNSKAVATVIIAARTVSIGSGFYNPPDQIGINDAFVTFKPSFGKLDLEVNVGGFANRYGSMGDYDTGRYDTPLIARIGGVGETTRATIGVGKLVFLAEHGLMGQFDRAPLGVEPAGWNDFADSNVGTSLANHAHLGLAAPGSGQLGLHYISVFTRDDRTAPSQPDGIINVYGADLNAELAQFGRLFLGAAYTHAVDSRGVSPVIRILNAGGGPGLIKNYFGPNSGGTGTLSTVGTQYDVSIGRIVRHPQPFSGYGPDLFASAFGIFTHVTSKDRAYDDVNKLKYGAELTYSALSWFAVSTRYDRVVADTSNASKTFAVVSPRVIFRSDFNSQDQVTLQYSRWVYGSGVAARSGYPAVEDPSLVPDENVFSLAASMWW